MLLNLTRLLKNVTVEPTLFFYLISYIMVEVVNMNLLLQKSCRFNATSEPDLTTACDDEKKGIIYASETNAVFRFVVIFVSIIYAIWATCWSDEAGLRRRPLILFPAIAMIFQGLSGCLHSYFWHWAPISAVLCDMVFEIMSGGVVMVITISHMYICDVFSTESRTMRMGILLAVKMASHLIADGGTGFILRRLGFFYTYLICAVLATLSFVFGLIFIKDISVPVQNKKPCLKYFNLTQVTDSFRVVFKKSLGRKRVIVLLLLIIYIAMCFLTYGEKTVFYLFLRYKFHWNEEDFSVYVLYRGVIIIFGTIFCSVVLSKYFKVHDGLIGAFASFWDTIAALGYLFASENWHIYAVPIFDMFHGSASFVCMSYYSKFYESHEIGRLNAVMHVFALPAPACHPIYNTVFQKTIDFFPSAFFLVSIALNVVVVFLYGATYVMSKKTDKPTSEVPALK
ncbi:probable peptidoglycan muropeptide transporter SLC46 [Planococcus citri]|uniref:probable peptidoglycan muropeptide transporter SLC46 n=1 Tax=Planococcus citri TaxID=170843 RepID=UPI0031F89DAC